MRFDAAKIVLQKLTQFDSLFLRPIFSPLQQTPSRVLQPLFVAVGFHVSGHFCPDLVNCLGANAAFHPASAVAAFAFQSAHTTKAHPLP